MFEREPSLHPGAAPVGGLYDHRRGRVAAHHGVSHRKAATGRGRVGPKLGEHQVLAPYLLLKFTVGRRVVSADPRANHGDRAAASIHGRSVRGAADALGQSAQTVVPCRASPAAMSRARRRPEVVGFRVPTTATLCASP